MRMFWAQAAAFVWGPVTVLVLMGTGIYLSAFLRLVHLREFRLAWKFTSHANTRHGDEKATGEISPWQSLMTMLAGAIGNGNIAGVATAIATGGPGAIFWMWASGLVAMATKYSEAVLGLHYRAKLEDGSVAGGPMFYLLEGMRHSNLTPASSLTMVSTKGATTFSFAPSARVFETAEKIIFPSWRSYTFICIVKTSTDDCATGSPTATKLS